MRLNEFFHRTARQFRPIPNNHTMINTVYISHVDNFTLKSGIEPTLDL